MTPEDVAQLQELGQYTIAPDGERIAYTTLHYPDVTSGEKDGRATQQLKVAWGPELGRDWLPAEMNVGALHFSPDGRTLSFTWAEPNGKDAVWGMPVDGGGHRKLAEVAGVHVRDYRWAPDGSALYMLAEPAPDDATIRRREAGFDAVVFEEELRFSRLIVARVGNTVDKSPREIRVPGEVSRFEIMPDGKRAVLASAPTPLVDDYYTASKLHVLNLSTGKVLRTFITTGKLGDFEVAPDGRHISLIASTDQRDPAPVTLYLGDIDTGTLTPLNAGAAEAAMDAEFMADGTLAVLIHKGARSVLRFHDMSGKVTREVDTGDVAVSSIAAVGSTLAARASTARHPSELFRLEGDSLQRWTNHNPWLTAIDFGPQRTVTYTARDGQAIEGVLIEPVGGVRNGKAPPLILDIHGGPETHETNGWTTSYSGPGQVAAGRGYAVFLPNYRGSTGYGTAFSKQHQGDYAGKEFNDLVDAKRALASMGLADPARVGITGASYGGYASGWAATALTNEFAASVMFVGISNQISKVGTTEIPNEMHLVHSLIWPWEDWQAMLDASPVTHAGKANTPLLILAGMDDTRVDPAQSHELYRAIKLRTDTPVRLVLYPREGHGNRKAAARYDYNLRMMEWFDHYLKGDGERTRATMPPPRPEMPRINGRK
ncbi:MAG: prolyl oligopeptidase family serine peptidase [Novosphingobium sp.]